MNDVFRALNDPNRRKIIELLREKPMNSGEIADHFNMKKPSISHHLDILKRAELIIPEKKGQYIKYTLNTTIIEDLLNWLIKFKK
ncbi:MAG: autorepressor SdpR family transcription factor [Psychroflexus sp.]|nr:autorepressor SdpR family transcription factor [Psychroflexus sp.]MDR9449500.1 autorepressor SdpR family transcription factor [Psychroflexus sp.]